MTRLAIVGSRGYFDLGAVRDFVRHCSLDTIIVTGGARGVDQAAEDEARRRGLDVEVHLPDYDKHGARAPLVRNATIAERWRARIMLGEEPTCVV